MNRIHIAPSKLLEAVEVADVESFGIDVEDGVKHNCPMLDKALKKVTGLS